MQDLDFLADDHTVLGSQVLHVVALVKALEGGRFSMSRLRGEVLRQAEILRSQLAEHFAFEEVTAFPHLEQKFPDYSPRIRAILSQHRGVMNAFENFWSDLNSEPIHGRVPYLLELVQAFEHLFEQHATEETQLLRELTGALESASG